MIGVSQIQDSVAQQHHQFFVLTRKGAGQRLITGAHHYPVPDPLPELSLCGPELPPVLADDESRLLLLFLFVFGLLATHLQNTLLPLRGLILSTGHSERDPKRSHT